MLLFGGLVLTLSLAGPGARAAAPRDPFAEPDESQLFRAEQELVTVASRYAQTVRQAPSIVTVVTAGDIRRAGHRTLSDVLRSLPGIYISVSKESRGLAWFRGTTSSDNNKFLLLVDGVPWYDGVYTHAWIDDYIPLDNVRQVEVIKGPGSALYGTNAFSGVVNVVTWDGRSLGGGFVRTLAGSDGRFGASAVYADMVQARGQEIEVRAYARALSFDGQGMDVVPRGRRNVSGLDPKRSINGGMRLGIGGFSASLDVVDYRHTYFTNEQDDALDVILQNPNNFALSYHDLFFSTRYEVDLGTLGKVTPYLYSQRHDNPGSYAWFNDLPVDGSTASWSTTTVETVKDTARHGVGVEATLTPALNHAVTTGVGMEATHILQLEDIYYVDRSHDPTTPSTFHADPGWITDAFVFAQDTWTATYWMELTGGARVDYHSYFGPFVSPRAGILLVPADQMLIKLLYGRAFRAPNARELLVQVGTDGQGQNLFTNGNPALLPELTDTLEAEITLTPERDLELRAATFASGIDQEINKATGNSPSLGDSYYANVGGALAVGGELEGRVERGPIELQASYAYTHATDRETGRPIYEFPAHMGHGRLAVHPVDLISASLLADVYGPRPRADWTPDSHLAEGPAFGLLTAAITADGLAHGRVSADLAIHNLLDTANTTLVPLEDANLVSDDGTPKYPNDLAGEGRAVQLSIEVRM